MALFFTPFATTDSLSAAVLNTKLGQLDAAIALGSVAVVSKTFADSPYTLGATDGAVLVNATGGAVTVNLPAAAANANRVVRVKKTDASANAVTVDANAAETIDGALTYAITRQYETVHFTSDGANWHTTTREVPGLGSATAPAYSFLGDSNTGIYSPGADRLGITTAGVARWEWSASGHYITPTDNVYDIGASGATRPRSLYTGTAVFAGGTTSVGHRAAQVNVPSNGSAAATLSTLSAQYRWVLLSEATNHGAMAIAAVQGNGAVTIFNSVAGVSGVSFAATSTPSGTQIGIYVTSNLLTAKTGAGVAAADVTLHQLG